MKKLFTLVALLACFLGAKAEWVEDVKQDYSTYNGFPFYVMGYVPEWVDGVMTDYGANYRYETQANLDGDGDGKWKDGESSVGTVTTSNGTEYQKVTGAGPYWHQYHISGNFAAELDGSYTVKAMVKASEACTIDVDLAWGWSGDKTLNAKVAIGTEWQEVEWEYSGVGAQECWITAKPGTTQATIEWKYVIVGHNAKAQRPTVSHEWLTNDGQPVIVEKTVQDIPNWMGNAETPWPDANVAYNDAEKNYLVCAWSKERMRNLGEPDANGNVGWNPFPADIEVDETNPNNHVFVCHGQPAITEGDASAWDNQFWIQSPKSWKAGEQVKVHFRYMCDYTGGGVTTNTQVHKQNPSDYLIWHAVGDITFTQEWQEYDDIMTIADDMATGWSIAFNLNANVKNAVKFYFDDLSIKEMKLDHGLYVAAANTKTGDDYDFDNATEFVYDADLAAYVATVGTAGKQDTWVNQVMISTVRGNDRMFKANTIKVSGIIDGTEDAWPNFTDGSNAKIDLPAAGVWRIAVDTENKQANFLFIEGEELVVKEAEDIVTNATEVIVKGQERDDLSDTFDQNTQERTGREEEGGAGETWDNQFFLVANRVLEAGEVTIVKFQYKANKEAKTTTQTHAQPGGYIHWAAIGDVNFTEEWQDFEYEYTIPSEAAGKDAQSIAFNMAEIKDACDYELKNFQWYLKYDEAGKTMENLIDAEGTKNFFVKEGAGTTPHEFGTDPETDGINNVVTNNNASAVIYNLAGQRVDNGYKGIVVKSGKKVMMK